MNDITLILGGTGKTGRRVVSRLETLGATLRVGSRSAPTPFDWEDESTWLPALHGVRAVYLIYTPDLAFPGADVAVRAFVDAAMRSGTRRIVLLSGRGEEGARRGEQIVIGSGAAWTVLRASWFDQNFSEGQLLGPVLSGEVALPAGEVAEPFVDADDIADVAAAALTSDAHVGRIYELTGPRLLTFGDACEAIARASGRDVRYVPVAPHEYAAALAEQLPRDLAERLTSLFVEVLDGRNAYVADGVQRALGREARDFADYAREAAATGVWRVHAPATALARSS